MKDRLRVVRHQDANPEREEALVEAVVDDPAVREGALKFFLSILNAIGNFASRTLR